MLGLRCDSAPEGHMLKRLSYYFLVHVTKSLLIQSRNQLILRLAEMSVVSERTGRNAAPSIIERFPLTLPITAQQPRCGRASTVQPNGAATVGLINHRHAASSLLSPLAGEKQQRELEIFQDWARSAIQTQRDDLCRIGGAVDRLERELKDVKDFMGNVRAELTTCRQFQESIKNKELRDIRQGLDVIQAELNTNRQFKNSLREDEFPVLQEDIDVLRSELAKAQDFQQELKHQDFRTLQQDVDALRRNVEGLAYLSEDDYRASIQKFEKRMNEVYEVVPKADEVNILRAEFLQLKARLASIESSVRDASATRETIAQTPHMSEKAPGAILQNHIGIPGLETSRLSKRSDLRVVHPSSYEHDHGQAKSLLKRKHFEAKSNNDKSYSPPAKRQMTSTGQAASINSKNDASKSLTVRFQAEYSPIIVSSNHGTPSPLLDRYSDNNAGNEDNVLNRSNDESMISNNLPQKPLSTGDVLSSRPKLPTGRSNGVSRVTIDNSVGKPSMNTDPKRTSLNRAQKSAEMSHKSVRVTTTNENQKYGSIRERSDTPDQLSTLSADEAMQKSVQKRRSGCVNGQGRNTFSGNIIETIGKLITSAFNSRYF